MAVTRCDPRGSSRRYAASRRKLWEIDGRWISQGRYTSRLLEAYVITFVEYLSKYVIAIAVPNRTAMTVATALVEEVMIKHCPFRELLTDGAKELVGIVTEELTKLVQAKHSMPVPYRPNLVGIVERFNRTWKDIVSMTTNAAQDD